MKGLIQETKVKLPHLKKIHEEVTRVLLKKRSP